LVSIIVVAHSEELAAGIVKVAGQMAGEASVPIFPAGGTEDGRLGTSLAKVERALKEALREGEHALIFVDLGSAVMVTQMAIESLDEDAQKRVHLTNAPLAEGAVAAVVAAAGGGTIDEVRRAAERALTTPKVPEMATMRMTSTLTAEEPYPGEKSVELTVPNSTGLHARPAARFVRTALRFNAEITVQNVTHRRPRANAKSMMEVANTGTARQGERIRVTAAGDDAEEALSALQALVESGFGEMEPGQTLGVQEQTGQIPESAAALLVAPVASLAQKLGDLQGVPASEGFVVGRAFVYRPLQLDVDRRTVSDISGQIARLHDALEQAQCQLTKLQAEVAQQDQDVAKIFEFQRMMLEDPTIVDAIEEEMLQTSSNAEAAAKSVMDRWVDRLGMDDNPVMRLRAVDVRDAGNRVLRILLGVTRKQRLSSLVEPVVVVADELTPSDTVQMDREKVQALCLAGGGATSHVAILARMWGLPAVVELGESVLRIPDGTTLAVDGHTGRVVIDPP
jgi:phosphocarrier protein FPr